MLPQISDLLFKQQILLYIKFGTITMLSSLCYLTVTYNSIVIYCLKVYINKLPLLIYGIGEDERSKIDGVHI